MTKIIPNNLLDLNQFENNIASLYGNSYASDPYRVFLVQNNSGNQMF